MGEDCFTVVIGKETRRGKVLGWRQGICSGGTSSPIINLTAKNRSPNSMLPHESISNSLDIVGKETIRD